MVTGLCLTCIPSHVFTVATNLASNICQPILSAVTTCNGQCFTETATYVPAVLTPVAVNEYLKIATCGKGTTKDANGNCIRSKTDWTTVDQIDAQTGFFLTCNTGYTLTKKGSFTFCVPAIKNCKTLLISGNNEIYCYECAKDANGMPYILDNSKTLCIAPQNYLPNCLTYNSSGVGCLKCNGGFEKLEAVGCNPPPNCVAFDPDTLRCTNCNGQSKRTPQGDCILVIPGKWAASVDCALAFNSTHCAECTNSKIIAIDDSDNDNQYGVGECVTPSINGCALPAGCELILRNIDPVNCKLTTYECVRCEIGYSNFGGKCFNNNDSWNKFPHECVNVEFDEDTKAYVCTECDFGYAITTDR